jgi:hypothetical protein
MSKTTIFLNQSTLTDLLTIIFVFVDDYLIALEREGVCPLPKLENQKGSYSEMMTISLVGELLKQRYAGDWFDFVKVEYARLFPNLPIGLASIASRTTWSASMPTLPCASPVHSQTSTPTSSTPKPYPSARAFVGKDLAP